MPEKDPQLGQLLLAANPGDSRIAEKLPVPPASKPKRGHRLVPVPASLAPQVALHHPIRETGITRIEAALGRRLVASVQSA